MKKSIENESELDDVLDQFDTLWHRHEIPEIDDFLPDKSDAFYEKVLNELIKIDLEYRWQLPILQRRKDSDPGLPWFPLLRDYQAHFPQLTDDGRFALDLIVEEYRVRWRWGDRPSHESYLAQFGYHNTLAESLQRMDTELGQRDIPAKPISVTTSLLRDIIPSTQFPNSPNDLNVGEKIDDFRLLNRLGAGAFAEVFLAQQISMQRLVALKVSAGGNYEPQLLSNLDHPNIVRVFDERRVGKLSLLYMQFVAGGSLKRIVDRMRADWAEPSGKALADTIAATLEEKGELPTYSQLDARIRQLDWGMTVCWIGAQLAEALEHAHGKQVLHRDIKPENVLLTPDAVPMLVDFNLSFGKSIVGMSASDRFGGSLAYMSPQQLRVFTSESEPEQVDASSDLFSLCVVLWELLTGNRPYNDEIEDKSNQQRLQKMLLLRQAGPDLAELPADCPGGLRRTLEECLMARSSAELSSVDTIVRRLHLSLVPDVDRLLNPDPTSWPASWARWPTTWLLIFGLFPNIALSALNIWANGLLTVESFDLELFRQKQQPVINAVNFSLGVLFGLLILVPVIKAMWAQKSGLFGELPAWQSIGHRCLRAPGLLFWLIFILWIESGIAFPLWNQTSPNSSVGISEFLAFFSSQVLHGLIAAAMTYVLISLVTVQGIYPRFLPEREDPTSDIHLASIDRQLGRVNACLGFTPFFVLVVLAGFSSQYIDPADQVDPSVFIALGVVGFIGYLMASILTPRIRLAIQTLRYAVSPTNMLKK